MLPPVVMLSEAKHLHLWEQPASTTCSPDATIADTPKTIDAARIVGVRTKETTLNEPPLTRFDTQRIAQHPANVMPAKPPVIPAVVSGNPGYFFQRRPTELSSAQAAVNPQSKLVAKPRAAPRLSRVRGWSEWTTS